MAKKYFDAPRPSSLRSVVATYFVLSFRECEDPLRHNALRNKDGCEAENKVELPFVRRMHQLLWWPPDIFALTSTVLARTGAYRMVVGPQGRIGKNLWQHLDWQARVNSHSEAWRSAVSKLLLTPADMKSIPQDEHNDDKQNYQKYFDATLWKEIDARCTDRSSRRQLEKLRFDSEEFDRNLDLNLLEILDPYPNFDNKDSPDRGKHSTYNLLKLFIGLITQLKDDDGPLADQNLLAVSVKADRYNRGIKGNSEERAAKFFEAIIGLHILADGASESIGVPRGSTHESAVFDALANTMLTLRGSLSTASKFYGVVLPKLHTPQSGLTLRNLSHNLTFHNSEVEVMWRSFPWSNFDENTLNILYVPHPFDFDPNRFKVDAEHYESVGYFTSLHGTKTMLKRYLKIDNGCVLS